jgi:hypothetical protein
MVAPDTKAGLQFIQTFHVEMIGGILPGGILLATTNDLRRYPRFNLPRGS